MMELQSNNNRIARNIFSSLCDSCEPNIWTVNTDKTSKEEIYKHFGVDGFDRVIGNPPFQAFQEASGKRGGGDELYMKFTKKGLDLLVDKGYLVFVHPPSWRKPEYNEGRKKSKNAGMFDLMAHQNQIEYLEIHSSKDGNKVFNAGTRYDFYTIKKTPCTKTTKVKDILGNTVDIDLRDFDFLPNFNLKNVQKLFPVRAEELCELGEFDEKTGRYINNPCILYERSSYGTDKKAWVSKDYNKDTFKYQLIHTTPIGTPRYYYSNTNKKGFFGIPKVIFGDSGINEPIIDLNGDYGMTQHAMALAISNKKDADRLVRFIKSNFFKNILAACMYSGFQIDWRLFTYFKRNFWEVEVDLDEKLINFKEIEDRPPQNAGFFSKTRKLRRH